MRLPQRLDYKEDMVESQIFLFVLSVRSIIIIQVCFFPIF